MKVIPLEDIVPLSPTDWSIWWEEEKKNLRLRYPDEENFPDDYYEKMESWWISSHKSRMIDPILVDEEYVLIDGHHRYAISVIHGIKEVPIIFED